MMEHLQTDYLVVGSGAAGMAFIDVLLAHSNAKILVVDRHHAPGGHWNDAYPFMRLHQPSAYYGVCSRQLGTDALDPSPLNAGMTERASAAELLAYYERLMQEYVASGRVIYLPRTDYVGDGVVRNLLSKKQLKVEVGRKIVDTTYLGTAVPSTHPPRYKIADGVRCVTPNDLPKIDGDYDSYTIVGGGKTGADVCLWLLENGVVADHIRWIMPRDAWWQNRANAQRGDSFFEATFGAITAQMESLADANSMPALFAALEEKKQLLRLDPNVVPEMYHGAIMSVDELALLRTIRDVVRLGRIERIEADKISLTQGKVASRPNTLYVDCSAAGLTRRPSVPVFGGNSITLQMVKPIQPVFSAALVARVETLDLPETDKNTLCLPTVVPDTPIDWLLVMLAGLSAQATWSANSDVKAWIASTRLDTFGMMARAVRPSDITRLDLLKRLSASAMPAIGNAKQLLKQQAADRVASDLVSGAPITAGAAA
jgi:NAD(P)-binding Rossmann-like domain